MNAVAGPSRLPRKSAKPFVSSDNRPSESEPDGIFRVVLITSGSVASIKAPDIAAALSQSGDVDLQIVSTNSATHFCNQAIVDEAVRKAYEGKGKTSELLPDDLGVRVWTDEDEWSDWKKVGEPILHIELRRWADLVVVAPCSANTLAKIAGGLCDNLATSLLRALSPQTPVIICPAMNTHMYQHKFTAKHLRIIQEELEYFVLGPQGGGVLACGDEGPGKMTDWREIVYTIENFAAMHKIKLEECKQQQAQQGTTRASSTAGADPTSRSRAEDPARPPTPPTPNRFDKDLPTINQLQIDGPVYKNGKLASSPASGSATGSRQLKDLDAKTASMEHWKDMQGEKYWKARWWAGV
ncbi:uncharacterized protein I303_104766 [Kwoniella dejecticola CBS 10117]|uniref:Flavoprotein domain-containing protein n=1 Tax=Kwoniella dejecticola CBS 10117 TaxID=1296121 RepID=A0A1A6A4E6_9TREE|nr:uncharacterized protein I303_04253 [Kwoniella dejecticola CBS 10117]OBR84929.1 hypothetical protein I303_04253 [Kwoniella dejecticola CBS 10117]